MPDDRLKRLQPEMNRMETAVAKLHYNVNLQLAWHYLKTKIEKELAPAPAHRPSYRQARLGAE